MTQRQSSYPPEYCFYQRGVDIRNSVSTSWPCKRQKKRNICSLSTFLSHPFIWFNILSEHSFFPFQDLGLDLLVNQNYMTCLLYRHVNETCMYEQPPSYMQGGCFVPGPVDEVLFFKFFPGLSQPPAWFMTVGQDSEEKTPQKTLALPEDRCWLWVRTKALILPNATSVPLHNKYFRSLKIWLNPANL